KAGWKVTAVDIVADVGTDFGVKLAGLGGTFVVGNALDSNRGSFDFVWEHTFLCAIAPYQRKAWSEMVRASVRPGGRFGALIFPGDKPLELGGPPWGYDLKRLHAWIGPGFELEQSEVVDPELEPRSWKQTFALFRRVEDTATEQPD
ncbi:MAG: class I SAM-dependent methyltransferase, partial [Planctomycetota bacterium]|nr:class I SAM-dependent methyltransferase [Planctomycetota bacterium]